MPDNEHEIVELRKTLEQLYEATEAFLDLFEDESRGGEGAPYRDDLNRLVEARGKTRLVLERTAIKDNV